MVKFNIKDLDIWFGTVQALKGASLYIQTNEILSVIGPANSGKTTFLRMLNRLNELELNFRMRGSVDMDGENISKIDPELLRKKVGMVFA
ncbi:MAG: ATP-binding cassette domain-containing protein, partial [Candidatus Omnitrophica bacterium]|nr:ATP-binding cassette domain-containing protein [Candidatus Omnitrophota bacterium]